MLEKSIVSGHKQQIFKPAWNFSFKLWLLNLCRSQQPMWSPTFLFNLRLAGLGGGHDGCSGLCDAPGRLLQTLQIGAVFVRFNLGMASSKHQTLSTIRSQSVCQVVARNSLLTFEAATSCAVLAAISCEHTISSSNFPLPCTTRSAASLRRGETQMNTVWALNCWGSD